MPRRYMCTVWAGSTTGLRRAGKPFRLRGRIDSLIASPESVTREDLIEFGLDDTPVDPRGR